VADLRHTLAAIGLSLTDLQRSAEQIVLFGSRAARVSRAGSDWDLLVIGEGRSRHTRALDLVCVSSRELATDTWLGSELAGHVARWGVWIHGVPDWTAAVTYGAAAADRKARRLTSRVAALERVWDILPSAYRREHHLMVRRDLQRHALLARAEAVPPTALLDETWQGYADPCVEMLRLGGGAGLRSAFLEALAAAST
jgi:hypothetical protein